MIYKNDSRQTQGNHRRTWQFSWYWRSFVCCSPSGCWCVEMTKWNYGPEFIAGWETIQMSDRLIKFSSDFFLNKGVIGMRWDAARVHTGGCLLVLRWWSNWHFSTHSDHKMFLSQMDEDGVSVPALFYQKHVTLFLYTLLLWNLP